MSFQASTIDKEKVKGKQINIGQFLACWFAAAIFTGILIHFQTGQKSWHILDLLADGMGYFCAMWIICAAVAVVAASSPRKGRWPSILAKAIIPAMILVCTVIWSQRQTARAAQQPQPQYGYRFQPPGCGYSVNFPSEPTRKVLTVPDMGDFEAAEWKGSSTIGALLLRAECMRLSSGANRLHGMNIKDYLTRTLSTYTHNNGLSSVAIEYRSTNLGEMATSRGYKDVGGEAVTVENTAIVGKESMLMLTVAGFSATYPPREKALFIDSVKAVE